MTERVRSDAIVEAIMAPLDATPAAWTVLTVLCAAGVLLWPVRPELLRFLQIGP